jgi:transposase-like protein
VSVLRVASALHSGDTIGQAARASGIGRTTLYRWLSLGRQGDPRFAGLADAVAVLQRDTLKIQIERMFRDGHSLPAADRSGKDNPEN